MIDYVEIRDTSRELIGIIDTANSIIWSSKYYSVGSFEVYASATAENLAMLKEGYYVTRPNNFEVGIIEHLEITENVEDGRMIIASGRFAKSLFDRRITYKRTYVEGEGLNYIRRFEPYILKGNVEKAVRGLVDTCLGSSATSERIINEIYLTDDDLSNLADIIQVDDGTGKLVAADKQTTYANLLEYTDTLLQEYEMGSYLYLDENTKKFRYKIFRGKDHSIEQDVNLQIIFSREFDNLTSSNYQFDATNLKTCAYIGGEGEGVERKCSYITDYQTGINRRETFINVSEISSTYKELVNGEEVEKTYTNEEYRKMLESEGRQKLSEYKITETFDGELDLTNIDITYGDDFELGDIITIEDKDLGRYIDARILVVTEVQDSDGYKIEIEYGV